MLIISITSIIRFEHRGTAVNHQEDQPELFRIVLS